MLGDFRFSEMLARVHCLMDALYIAQQVGTVGAVDRSKQYTDPSQTEILRALNQAHTKIRQLQHDKDVEIAARKKAERKSLALAGALSVLTTIITALAWEGAKSIAAYLPDF